MLIWKIAWRNLWRHQSKSLIVGVILFAGALLMTVGNALLDGALQGLEENTVNRMTGHLVVTSVDQTDKDLFFAPEPVADITNYPAVRAVLAQQDYLAGTLPLTRGNVMLLNETGRASEAFVLGVNFDAYQRFFLANVTVVEGALLKNGERGILISDETRQTLFDRQKYWLAPAGVELNPAQLTPKAREKFAHGNLPVKRDLVLLGFGKNAMGTDIRLPVKGIFRFKQLNKVWALNNFMDIESYRECFGYVTAAAKAVQLSQEQQTLLATEGDKLFADENMVTEADVTTENYDVAAMQQHTQRVNVPVDLDNGAYNLVFVKLKPGISVAEGYTRLNHALKQANLGVRAITWKESLGEMDAITAIMQGGLFTFVLFVFFVALLIIMNTLIIAILERTAEIGMMRAIGAGKGFIGGMFLAETVQLAVVFGGAGILTGMLLAWGLAALKLSVAHNEVLAMLCGGDVLHPVIRAGGVGLGLVQLAIVTLLSVLYPIFVARKITPLEAIARD